MGKILGNIGVLDITTATPDSISGIDRIGNLGMLLYSTKTAGLMTKLNISNLGISMEVPENYKLIQGKLEMDKNYFKNIKQPVSLIVMGQVIIKPDALEEDIENAIKDIIVNGQIICPENLVSVVQSKCSKLNGKMLAYSGNHSVMMGSFSINNGFLKSIEENVSLALLGKVDFVDNIDEELFNRKIKNMDVIGKMTIKEEYLELLNSKTKDAGLCNTEIIPAGYIYTDSDINLDSITIKRFNYAKLYVSGMICIENGITKEMLRTHIDKIVAEDFIVCRTELKEAVYGLCDDVSVNICDYSEKVFIVEGERKLTQSELKYIPSQVTYIVQGSLSIADDVLPETFMEKVEHIDNFGEIICDAQHYGLVQAKLRTSSGEVMEKGSEEDSNIGYLKL